MVLNFVVTSIDSISCEPSSGWRIRKRMSRGGRNKLSKGILGPCGTAPSEMSRGHFRKARHRVELRARDLEHFFVSARKRKTLPLFGLLAQSVWRSIGVSPVMSTASRGSELPHATLTAFSARSVSWEGPSLRHVSGGASCRPHEPTWDSSVTRLVAPVRVPFMWMIAFMARCQVVDVNCRSKICGKTVFGAG